MIPNYPPPQMRPYNNLVNQLPKNPAMYPQAMPAYQCYMKGQRVVKGNAAMSIVYSKIIGHPICGSPEPQGAPDGGPQPYTPLTDAEICMFYTWIQAGAQFN
jgi:hypothetical protein